MLRAIKTPKGMRMPNARNISEPCSGASGRCWAGAAAAAPETRLSSEEPWVVGAEPWKARLFLPALAPRAQTTLDEGSV